MTTIEEARAYLRAHMKEGARCPCCTQRVQVYRRRITSQMARALIALYRTHGTDYGHMQDALDVAGVKRADEAKLVYWGLIEPLDDQRLDGGPSGHWRVTMRGRDWLLGHTTVPGVARVFDGRCLGLEGEPVSIQDALGTKFSLRQLLNGEAA